MAIFDFRSAHITLVAAAVACTCAVLSDVAGLSSVALLGVGPSTTAAARSGGGIIRSINNLFSGGNSVLGSTVRALALPLAWPSLLSLFCLVQYGRALERRFGTARFAVLGLFIGSSAAVLHRALVTVAAHGAGFSTAAFFAVNSSVWNAVIISLATLATLRIPASSRRPATTAQNNNRNQQQQQNGTVANARAYLPVVLSTVAAGLSSHASAALLFGSGAGARYSVQHFGRSPSFFMRNVVSALCALVAGAVPAAAVHFYRPLMETLNSAGDAAPQRSVVNRLLYGDANGVFYVRQHGAERQQAAAMRHAAEDNDEQLRAAIRASMADRGGAGAGAAAQQHGGGGPAGADEVRVLAGDNNGPRRRGVNPQNMMFAHQHQQAPPPPPRAAAVQHQPAAAGPPTPAERDALVFLREITPHVADAQMLAVLRTCRGDANSAAALLLEGSG